MRLSTAAFALALALGMPAVPVTAAPTKQAQAEIDHLREYLARSGCKFYRNGDWHDAASARRHIDRKYAYLREREMADTAELFIERAASRSSRSGKAYQVRCDGAKAVEASRWFRGELERFRRS